MEVRLKDVVNQLLTYHAGCCREMHTAAEAAVRERAFVKAEAAREIMARLMLTVVPEQWRDAVRSDISARIEASTTGLYINNNLWEER